MRLQVRLEGPGLERLRRIPGLLERARERAAKAAAERYVDEIHDYVASHRPFQSHTYNLLDSIGWVPFRGGAYVYAATRYARYVEHGTRPHLIRPKPPNKVLRWLTPGGEARFARKVRHPGTKPRPFFFADFEKRKRGMLEAARQAVAYELGLSHG